MDRPEDRWLVVAIIALVFLALAYLIESGRFADVLSTILGGGILAGLLTLAWRFWRNEQEERLIRAFRELYKRNRKAQPIYKAVNEARLQDPSPVLDRLLRKRHLVVCYRRQISEVPPSEYLTDKDPIDPDYLSITPDGLQRANRERPSLLRRLLRG